MKKKQEKTFSKENFTTVSNAYIKLFDNFKIACENDSLKVKSPDSTGFSHENIEKNTVSFKFRLYLPNWPYKKGGKNELHIFITSSEIFSFETKEVIKSNVGLKYLKDVSEEVVKPILDIHYDYEKIVPPAHPVFHVQLGNVEVSAETKDQVHFRKTIEERSDLLYSNVRIPTPYMNITSVLLSLAADHLKVENYLDFLGKVRQSEVVKWEVACSPLDTCLRDDGNVHSHSWYFDQMAKKVAI